MNRSPTLSVKNITLEEVWSRQKSTVDHFKVFGCRAYAHVPDEKRKKLNAMGEKCIFLGIGDQSKAYKLYNPNTKKIVISCDVVFYENQIWSWTQNAARQPISTDFDRENEV